VRDEPERADNLVVVGRGYEQLLAAHRRGSKPAQTVALPSFVGSSALARAAAGNWPPEDTPAAEPELVAKLAVAAHPHIRLLGPGG
jgi:hypothetical protein